MVHGPLNKLVNGISQIGMVTQVFECRNHSYIRDKHMFGSTNGDPCSCLLQIASVSANVSCLYTVCTRFELFCAEGDLCGLMLFFQGLSCFFGSEAIRPLSRVAMTRLPAPPLHRFDCARTSRFEPHFWVQPPRSRRAPSRWATGHLVKSFID